MSNSTLTVLAIQRSNNIQGHQSQPLSDVLFHTLFYYGIHYDKCCMSTYSVYSSNILTVKNFPLLFNNNDRKEFLEHFGAVHIRCLSRFKNISNLIVADFGSNSQASQALRRLHQLEVLARRLVVEYCPSELAHLVFSSYSHSYDDNELTLLHGISPGINQIHYLLPSERLSYVYPPIDDTILMNINNALLSVPSFYTQVLHLMNKMSLPCPMIADSTKTSRSLSKISVACQTDESIFSEVINMDTDEDESEIDDGEEEQRIKRRHQSVLRASIRQGKVVPTTQMNITSDIEKKKKPKIELKLPQTLNSSRMEINNSLPMDITMHGFGLLEPVQSSITSVDIVNQEKEQLLLPLPLISLEEIRKNRLNEDQLRLIDNGRLYRNYERGQSSQRLYIKNLNAKHVDERILHSIYDRYKENSFDIDIRLMREGKMKGQAFVTFPNEDMALQALNDTNGFILYEKPMIVQFARTAKPKDIV
ncbi:unnamed protein product [Rotaria sordida]|uniref:RRM domain-containing protein n=1 Tax=Rotaria sordida TaxID=392033 RepID=A0A814SPU5_9BILA|nr:unnamed protein product [Rotaria sordida]CAF1150578.1 unnamed protein product [Rotaria sordida]